jgi:hypothetical protein
MIATAEVLAPTKIILILHSRKSVIGFMLSQKTLLETVASKNVLKMTLAIKRGALVLKLDLFV